MSDSTPELQALVAFLHSRNEFDYDECEHGTYSGGPSHGEPYAMCERQGRALLAWLPRQGYKRNDSEDWTLNDAQE